MKRKFEQILALLDESKDSLIQKTMHHKKIVYAPWSRYHFSQRLATFWLFPCHNLNSPLNAVAWAKRGWKCMDRVKLQCELCHRQLQLMDINESPEIVFQNELINDTFILGIDVSLIETGHAEGCSWRRRSCDASIMKLPLADRLTSIKAYNERLNALNAIKQLPKVLKTPQNLEKSSLMRTEILSLFGWTCMTIDTIMLLVCTACHRRIGLWGFEEETENAFDVISEHRDYCPWINSTSQASIEPGWKLLNRWLGFTTENVIMQDALDVRLDRLRSVFGLKTISSK
ncbi:hypothetical protein PCANB_002599 [Pneumocystis canis]|nr:hypothetical protein PCANB_002599 [Pneumocystis canis]